MKGVVTHVMIVTRPIRCLCLEAVPLFIAVAEIGFCSISRRARF